MDERNIDMDIRTLAKFYTFASSKKVLKCRSLHIH